MNNISVDDFLEHHGVKGMRWGVVKSTNRVRRSKTTNPDRNLATKNPKVLSDEQLKKGLNRLQLEKQYKDLTRPEISAGKKYATEILTNSGKDVLTALTTYAMYKGVEKTLNLKADKLKLSKIK